IWKGDLERRLSVLAPGMCEGQIRQDETYLMFADWNEQSVQSYPVDGLVVSGAIPIESAAHVIESLRENARWEAARIIAISVGVLAGIAVLGVVARAYGRRMQRGRG